MNFNFEFYHIFPTSVKVSTKSITNFEASGKHGTDIEAITMFRSNGF